MTNNNDDEVVASMIDTIELFLQEASAADDNTQCQLLLQTESFFRKVMKLDFQESPQFPRFLKCFQSFFQFLNSHLTVFLSDNKRSKTFADLLLFFANSSIAAKIANDLSTFTNAFLLTNDLNEETINDFTPFLHIFFTSPAFAQPFEAIGGLTCFWKLLLNQSKVSLFETLFSDLNQTINLYFQSKDTDKTNEFSTSIAETIKDLPMSNSTRAFKFIYDLIIASKSKVLLPFINQGVFYSFNRYIIDHDDPSLLSFYEMFLPICTSPNVMPKYSDEEHPIIGELIKLFGFPEISETIQKKAMLLLSNSLSLFPKEYCPIQSEGLYVVASSLKPDQKESALLLFQISHYLMTHFDFDITLTIPLFFPFYDYKFFVENDVQNLFIVLKMSEDSFLPFVPLFFTSITKNITPEQFFDLIEKYPSILEFLDVYVNDNIFDDHLLTLFYSISPLFKDRKMYSKVLIQLLFEEEKVDFLFKFLTTKDANFADSILNEIAQLFCYSKKLRSCPHSIRFLNKINFEQVSPSTVFNVIIGLSGKFYNQILDASLVHFLKKHDFFNMTKEDIKKLAFGIFLNVEMKEGSEHLIFPSLLPFCGDDFQIVYPFDKWICGQYGIDIWLAETGQTIDKFPSITSVANRYLLPKHVSMLLEYPKIISECCKDSFQNNPTFEFASNLTNTMISFPISESIRTVSFWFSINSLPTEKVRIINFFNCNLIVCNNSMTLNGTELFNVTINRWIHIVMIVNDKITTCTCYVNGKQTLQYNITAQDNTNDYSFFDSDYDEEIKIMKNENSNNLKNKNKCYCLKFGSASINPIQWYIGGAIRIYSQVIQNDTIEFLFSTGVSNTVKNMKPSESLFITANNFIEIFEGTNPNLSKRYLSENSRPAISFSFLRHLNNAYNGGQCLLDIIKKYIQDGDGKENEQNINESINYLIDALCKMQKLQYTNWKLSLFAVHMSSLFYLRPSIFNENILTSIFSCFSSELNDTINWEDVLVLIFDFGLFNTSNRSFVISKLFEFSVQYSCDENASPNLLNFIFHILFLFDKELQDSEFDILIGLIDKFHPTPAQISYMLQASLNFNDNLVNPTFQYNKELFEGRIYKRLFEIFINTIDDKFCDYHLIYILQPSNSLELIDKILHLTSKKKIPSNCINQIIFFCMAHSEIKESWPILLNLLLTVKTKKLAGQYIESIETLITNSTVDSESLFKLIIALSFLSIHILNQPEEELKTENNFWMNLWNFLYTFAFSNSSLFSSDVLSSKKYIAAILQLLSLGFYTPEKVIFPFCPSLENPEEIIKYCIMPGQPFPTEPGTNPIRTNAIFKSKSGNEVYNSITRTIPQVHHLPPPYGESTITSHKKMYDINFVNKVIEDNKSKICTHWHTFIPKANYSVEAALKSSISKDIITFVVKICSGLKLVDPKPNVKRSSSTNETIPLAEATNNSSASAIESSSNLIQNLNDDDDEVQTINNQADLTTDSASSNSPMDFNRFFLNIVTLIESINTKYSMKLISKFVIEILKYLISKKKTGLFIIRFICRRISSGWFEQESLLEIITNILSIPIKGKDKSMKNILQVLIFTFKNIPQENFKDYLKLFTLQSDKIFNALNFENDWFIVLLFGLLYSNKSNQECSEQITSITKAFADALKQSCKKIKDKNILQMRNSIISGLLELNNSSKRSSYEPDEYITKLITEKKEEFQTKIQNSLITSLKQDIVHRTTSTAHFYQSINEFLDIFNTFDVCARSISSIIRFNDRRLLLFDLNCFLRLHEKVLTSFPFNDNSTFIDKTTTKTVSLLNDPINPTRRFERSPMIYRIPPFPSVSKNVVSVMPYPLPEYRDVLSILPQSLYDLLSIDFQSFEVMVLHQLKPHVLSFSYHFDIDDALLLSIVLNFVTREKAKLKFLGDASILYGISPLKGVLIMDSRNIYFVEGLKLTNDGCTFSDNINADMNDIIYEFYISYLDSGYFGQPYMFCGHPLIQVPLSQLILSMPHLWLQKEVALELNFLLGWTFIIVTKNNEDYLSLTKSINEIVDHNIGKTHYYNKFPSPINNSRLLHLSVRDVSKLWVDGHISNSTYLLYLNKTAGRSFVDFSQFNVFPWIISDYSTSLYESIPDESFRDLALPMGQIGTERTPRFQLFFETSKYFYGTHYMHLGVVLFYLFRIDPFCLFSIYFHHGWDHPSRLFSDFTEAWLSAAHVSQNDVKEIVPQLFKCPEFLSNMSHLPLTISESQASSQSQPNQPPMPQNIENVKLGRWSNNPRDFTRIMSAELESERVSKSLNNWIDLIFGVKSRGEQAIEAKNVFPPLCYSDANASQSTSQGQADERNLIEEEVERKAAEASIINFGQCPRQLFKNIHSAKNKIEPKSHLLSDTRLILHQSLNCSAFLPSALPASDVFIGSTNIFIAPSKGIVLNATTTIQFSYDMSAIISYSNGVYNSIAAAKAKAKAKARNYGRSNQRSNTLVKDESTDDDDTEDDDDFQAKLNLASSLPSLKSVAPLALDVAEQVDSSISSSYQDFSNLVGALDSNVQTAEPSPLTFNDSEAEVALSCNSSSGVLHSNATIDFASNLRMKVLFRCPNSVHFIVKSPDGSLVSLFLKEGSFIVCSLSYEKGEVKSGVRLMRFSTSSSEILTAAISSLHFLAIVVCNDAQKGSRICRYDLGLMQQLDPIDAPFPVRKVAIDDHSATIIACGDGQIAVFTVSGQIVAQKSLEEETDKTAITAVAVANLEEHISNRFFVTGHSDGFVRFWSTNLSQSKIDLLKEFRVCSSAVDLVSIASDDDNNFEVTGNALRAVAISSLPQMKMFGFEFYASNAKSLRKEYAVRCAVCGKRFDEIKQKPIVCYGCHRFFCKDCALKTDKKLCRSCKELKS